MLEKHAKTRTVVAINLKTKAKHNRPAGPSVNSRARKGVDKLIFNVLLSAEGAAQNPAKSDLDICFVPALQASKLDSLDYPCPYGQGY